MEIRFQHLLFQVNDDKIRLTDCGHFHSNRGFGIAEVQIAGENKPTHLGAKLIRSSEGDRLKYVSHEMTDRALCIVQESDLVRVQTLFLGYSDTNTIEEPSGCTIKSGLSVVGLSPVHTRYSYCLFGWAVTCTT